ncbi:MAG: hypothetical protein KAR62_06175, partial [Sphingomonadales bacterium]|nr:hypothetical protein [Sphingomonadales bacterium]
IFWQIHILKKYKSGYNLPKRQPQLMKQTQKHYKFSQTPITHQPYKKAGARPLNPKLIPQKMANKPAKTDKPLKAIFDPCGE